MMPMEDFGCSDAFFFCRRAASTSSWGGSMVNTTNCEPKNCGGGALNAGPLPAPGRSCGRPM